MDMASVCMRPVFLEPVQDVVRPPPASLTCQFLEYPHPPLMVLRVVAPSSCSLSLGFQRSTAQRIEFVLHTRSFARYSDTPCDQLITCATHRPVPKESPYVSPGISARSDVTMIGSECSLAKPMIAAAW